MPDPIVRKEELKTPEVITPITELQYEWLGMAVNVEQIFDELVPETELEDESVCEEFTSTFVSDNWEYKIITEPSAIINADIDSHILVNAGPGTGKTYSVIEKLAHIIRTDAVELSQILVLCYTNAAKDVILQRLTDKGMGEEAQQLVICTLDSLAWQNLVAKLENETQIKVLMNLGYNECIKKFNNSFDADEWSDFQYIIIDEIQDLVNERARMALKIINAVSCGYLLLGDRCQAIYDYDCTDDDAVTSDEFYEQLNAILPENALRYELVGSRRQTTVLSELTDGLRRALLENNLSFANDYLRKLVDEQGSIPFSAELFENESDQERIAILTRKNGEAEWVSAQLHKHDINHTLLRSVTPQVSLNRWIADMFWDYCEPRISKSSFVERYQIRVEDNIIIAENAYEALVSLLPEEKRTRDYFVIDEIRDSINSALPLSSLLLNISCDPLTVSTIHKSKGREYDDVCLFCDFQYPLTVEELRVVYVGLTRAKKGLIFMQKGNWPVRRSKNAMARCIWAIRNRWKRLHFCSKIVVGLHNDVCPRGFIASDLERSIALQSYIANNINVNDVVDIRFENNAYNVYHNCTNIGMLSDGTPDELLLSIYSIVGWGSTPPPHLSNVYIKNLVTILPRGFSSGINELFKTSKFWLGVELTGFADIDWYWKAEEQ